MLKTNGSFRKSIRLRAISEGRGLNIQKYIETNLFNNKINLVKKVCS